jgi:histidinol-phosphate aminotransferase
MRRPRARRTYTRLDRNESPFGTTAGVLGAWERQRTADPRKYGLNRYGDFFQVDMLDALARRHGLTPANYTPLAGPGEVATVLAAALARGAELVQSRPMEELVSAPARAWGARIVAVPLDRQGRQDLGALAAAVGPRTALVHVQNPHDPAGRSFGQGELEGLLDAVGRRNADTYVWVDESYAGYSTRPDFPDSFALIGRDPESSRLVVSRSLTTGQGIAGSPVAYLAASRELTHRTEGVTTGVFVPGAYGWANTEAEVDRMSEKALLELLGPDGDRHLDEVRGLNLAGRDRLAGLLARHRFAVVPTDASFVFARAPPSPPLA